MTEAKDIHRLESQLEAPPRSGTIGWAATRTELERSTGDSFAQGMATMSAMGVGSVKGEASGV